MSILRGAPKPGSSADSAGRRIDATDLSIIAPGTTIVGDIDVQGVIKVEGRVQGSVRATGQVLVAKGGLIEGDLFTREAVIGGEVHGTVRAEERVEVQPGAAVTGDILTQRILIAEGGQVNGAVSMAEQGVPTIVEKSPKPVETGTLPDGGK
jgi:cytoskeletal protein CcmA (bactofilin family)